MYFLQKVHTNWLFLGCISNEKGRETMDNWVCNTIGNGYVQGIVIILRNSISTQTKDKLPIVSSIISKMDKI